MSYVMDDDYNVPSLYVKRVPIGSSGSAVMCCYKSWYRVYSETPNIPDWEECETIHDKRPRGEARDIMVVRVFQDLEGEDKAMQISMPMFIYFFSEYPFVMVDNHAMIFGRGLVERALESIKKHDEMQEVFIVKGNYDERSLEYLWERVTEEMMNGDVQYNVKGFVDNADNHDAKLTEYAELGLNVTVTLTQRIAVVGATWRAGSCRIRGIMDSAVMIGMHGMMVGVEQDGYIHS